MGSSLLEIIMSTCQSKSSTMPFFFVAASCLLAVQSQELFLGSCPNVSVMSPFDITQYTGEWYENSKNFVIFEMGQKRNKAQYSLNDDGTVEVYNSGIEISTGEAVGTEANTGNMVIDFNNLDNLHNNTANIFVLGTDYTSFTVVWSCFDLFGLANTQFLWIFTREQVPSDEVLDEALAVIEYNGLNQTNLVKIDH